MDKIDALTHKHIDHLDHKHTARQTPWHAHIHTDINMTGQRSKGQDTQTHTHKYRELCVQHEQARPAC